MVTHFLLLGLSLLSFVDSGGNSVIESALESHGLNEIWFGALFSIAVGGIFSTQTITPYSAFKYQLRVTINVMSLVVWAALAAWLLHHSYFIPMLCNAIVLTGYHAYEVYFRLVRGKHA